MKTQAQLATEFENLHDSVLLSLEMQWAEGTVTLSIRAAAGPKRVVVQRVTRLVCPREHPWGPSVCINDVRLSKLASNEAFQMEIEMQSGDVLSILGSDISLEP